MMEAVQPIAILETERDLLGTLGEGYGLVETQLLAPYGTTMRNAVSLLVKSLDMFCVKKAMTPWLRLLKDYLTLPAYLLTPGDSRRAKPKRQKPQSQLQDAFWYIHIKTGIVINQVIAFARLLEAQ
jgi:hypothetical protein